MWCPLWGTDWLLKYYLDELSSGTHVRRNIGQGICVIFRLPDCWPVVSMHPEGPATGHLDTGFLGFPLSSSKCWDGSHVPSCYCMLLMQPCVCKFIKIIPCYGCCQITWFYKLLWDNQKFKITLSVWNHLLSLCLHFHIISFIRTSGLSLGTFFLPPRKKKLSVSNFSPWFPVCIFSSYILPFSVRL
jgi:hypothetical protein